MAKQKKKVTAVSTTLSTGTKVTAPQEVIDKIQKQGGAKSTQTSRSASK